MTTSEAESAPTPGSGEPTTRRRAWLKPFRSAGVLLVGRTAQAIFSLGALTLAARALTPTEFGVLAMLHSFVLMVGETVRFQSWQPVLRFGAQALEAGDRSKLQRLVKFALLLDAIAVVMGLAIVLFAVGPLSILLDIPPEHHETARIYGLSVVFILVSGTPDGILRLYERFDLISVRTAIGPAVRLLGAMAVVAIGPSLAGFLAVWFLGTVANRGFMLAAGWRELYCRSGTVGLFASFDGIFRPTPGAWRFSLATNAASSLNMVQTNMSVLIVGALLDPAAAGLLRVARQFADILAKPAQKLLVPAIYPELAKLTAAGKNRTRKKMVLRSALLAGGIGGGLFVVLAIFGETLITLIVGAGYVQAYPTMLLLAVSGLIGIWFFPLLPLLNSMGHVRVVVIVQLVAVTLYLVTLYYGLTRYGLIGAGVAQIAHVLCSGPLLLWASWRKLRRALR